MSDKAMDPDDSPVPAGGDLEQDEMRTILRHIARTGSDSNRIQAIRELQRLDGEQPDDEDEFERNLVNGNPAARVK